MSIIGQAICRVHGYFDTGARKVDISKLVVGQTVTIVSGIYGKDARVVKVTPSEVIVQLLLAEGPIRPEGNELIRFNSKGKATYSSDIYKGNMEFGGVPGTFECGPWELELPVETVAPTNSAVGD